MVYGSKDLDKKHFNPKGDSWKPLKQIIKSIVAMAMLGQLILQFEINLIMSCVICRFQNKLSP